MYFNEVLWQKKRRIQKERLYQMERNKEISVLKKESRSLSRILGEMKQELDVLMACNKHFGQDLKLNSKN